MRLEIAGADITDAMVEVLDDLQNSVGLLKTYTDTLDELTRQTILSITGIDEKDAFVLGRLRVLQHIRQSLITLGDPPDAGDPSNDTPLLQL